MAALSACRTLMPSSTIFLAKAVCACSPSTMRTALPWPAEMAPSDSKARTAGGRAVSRSALAMAGRDLPIRRASSSWVRPKSVSRAR